MGNAGSTWSAASGSTDVSFFAGFCQWRWRQRRAARWARGKVMTILGGKQPMHNGDVNGKRKKLPRNARQGSM